MLDNEDVGDYQISDGAIYSRFDQSVCISDGQGQDIKGIIFDLDDTLYSEKDYVRSGYKAVSEYLGGSYEDKLWKFFESGKAAIDELLKEISREDEKIKVLDIYRSHKPDIHLYPGVEEVLKELRNKGYKIGIITDGRPDGQSNKIEALGIDKVIGRENVIITDELGGIQFRKPCDIAFRIMLTRWRMNPADVMYVGDNPAKDFQAPQQLGMKYVWFKNPDGLYKAEVENPYVQSIDELRGMLIN